MGVRFEMVEVGMKYHCRWCDDDRFLPVWATLFPDNDAWYCESCGKQVEEKNVYDSLPAAENKWEEGKTWSGEESRFTQECSGQKKPTGSNQTAKDAPKILLTEKLSAEKIG